MACGPNVNQAECLGLGPGDRRMAAPQPTVRWMMLRRQVLEELRGVNELVTAKATPQEVEAFRRWLVAAAQAAAAAAKEGGFMGFGAEQVSAGGAADVGAGARRARGGLTSRSRPAPSPSPGCARPEPILIRTVRVLHSCWSNGNDQLMGRARLTVVVRWAPCVSARCGTWLARRRGRRRSNLEATAPSLGKGEACPRRPLLRCQASSGGAPAKPEELVHIFGGKLSIHLRRHPSVSA
jgi:hypothetical protein